MHRNKSVFSCMFNIPTGCQLSSGMSFLFKGYKIATDFVFLNYFTVWCSGDAPALAVLYWFVWCEAYLFLLCSRKVRVSWCCSSLSAARYLKFFWAAFGPGLAILFCNVFGKMSHCRKGHGWKVLIVFKLSMPHSGIFLHFHFYLGPLFSDSRKC